jgi:uncharacterized protein (DUF934 family)
VALSALERLSRITLGQASAVRTVGQALVQQISLVERTSSRTMVSNTSIVDLAGGVVGEILHRAAAPQLPSNPQSTV